MSFFPILITHPTAFDASLIALVRLENASTSAAVVGPIVGKLKGIRSALEEYLFVVGKDCLNKSSGGGINAHACIPSFKFILFLSWS